MRSGLYGEPVPETELPDSIDWRVIAALAKKHTVQGIIIESVEYLPEHLCPSAETYAKMQRFALGLIQANAVVDKTVARLVSFFEPYGIHGVLLKGQGVARYYRKPPMRHNGDIDFYVGKKNYKKAVAVCNEKLVKEKNDCGETDQHFAFFIGKIPIELHRLATRVYSPRRNKRMQRWIVDQLEHSPDRRALAIDGVEVTLPSYDFDAIFIFYHGWRHFITGGIGLRQLCDWAMVFWSHYDDIDIERLIENIHAFGITNGWKLFACIAVEHLGLPADKMPLYDPAFSKKSEKVLEEILSGGNFGYYSEDYMALPASRSSLAYSLRKFRSAANYFFTLFPLMPAESTFLFFNRLYIGTIAVAKRAISGK
ncbi:MAG: nucleotidyltransferase family protein [Muribaculaceae bacterium]|nr:nucleotidyltransferase family protein [Muribaculaceae bacterium]